MKRKPVKLVTPMTRVEYNRNFRLLLLIEGQALPRQKILQQTTYIHAIFGTLNGPDNAGLTDDIQEGIVLDESLDAYRTKATQKYNTYEKQEAAGIDPHADIRQEIVEVGEKSKPIKSKDQSKRRPGQVIKAISDEEVEQLNPPPQPRVAPKPVVKTVAVKLEPQNERESDPVIPQLHKKETTISNAEKQRQITLEPSFEFPDHQEEDTPSTTYQNPPHEIFEYIKKADQDLSWIEDNISKINQQMEIFKIAGRVISYKKGPSITLYLIQTDPGVRISIFQTFKNDFQMVLAAKSIRILTPLPGTNFVGLEMENGTKEVVSFRECLDDKQYWTDKNPLLTVLGVNLDNEKVFLDLAKAPHVLVSGSTNSGKSVCMNNLIISLISRNHPDKVKLILVDPKRVEFLNYLDIPHLLAPVIQDSLKCKQILKWLVEEMHRRYDLLAQAGVKNIKSYQEKLRIENNNSEELPYIVVAIDELAQLNTSYSVQIEDYLKQLAQMARAAGIHLILATQRPTVNIVKGDIKTNIGTRIALKMPSGVDSRSIIDTDDATSLIGYGDMYLKVESELVRLQGAYISDQEIVKCVNFIKKQAPTNYLVDFDDEEIVLKADQDLKLTRDAAYFIVSNNSASNNLLQQQFSIGFNRANRLLEDLEKLGIIGPSAGTKSRDILVTLSQLERII